MRIELRHSTMLIAFPVLLAAGAFLFASQAGKGEGQWPEILASVNASLIVIGPLMAGVAAWAGTREARRRMVYLRQLSARSPGTVLLVPLVSTALWALAALIVILLLAVGYGIWTGAWAWPSPTWILRILAAGLVFIPVPFIMGHALPRRFTPPAMAVLAYLAVGLVEVYLFGIWPLYALSPLPGTSGTIWYTYNQALSGGQTLWFAGFAALSVAAWLLLLNRGQQDSPGPVRTVAATAAAVTAVGIAIVMVQHGRVYSDRPASYQPVCSGAHPVVCVHPAFTSELAAVAPVAGLLSDRLQATPAAFDRLVQRQAGGDPPLGSRSGPPSFALLSADAAGAATVMQQLVEQSYLPACTQHPGAADQTMLQQAVVQWLAYPSTRHFTPYLGGPSDTKLDQAVQAFTDKSEQQKRAWLDQHYAAFRTCSLRVRMLRPASS